MTDNWKEITDPEELFKLKREGWEIDVNTGGIMFQTWNMRVWDKNWKFRARPRQPVMKKGKLLAYVSNSFMYYVRDTAPDEVVSRFWVRVPSEDKEVEIPNEDTN